MFFLDTNICIYFLNGKFEKVKEKIVSTPPNLIGIPSVVKAELIFGAYKSRKREDNLERVERFLAPFEIIPFDNRMAYTYAEIRSQAESTGAIIGPNDLFIASIVLFNKGTLVTGNRGEFERIRGLNVENWSE